MAMALTFQLTLMLAVRWQVGWRPLASGPTVARWSLPTATMPTNATGGPPALCYLGKSVDTVASWVQCFDTVV